MRYIKTTPAGDFEKFLPNILTEWDENNFCTPEALVVDGKAQDFNVVEVIETSKPTFDALTEYVAEITPDRVDGVWAQQWEVFPLTEDQVEANKEALIPKEVTMGQCRLALYDLHGIEDDAEFLGLTDLLPEEHRARAKLELRTRTSVFYDNPLVIAVCDAKGWDRAELFTYAATL